MTSSPTHRTQRRLGAVLLTGGLALAAACGSSSSTGAASTTSSTTSSGRGTGPASTAPGEQVLPVSTNPIRSTATATPLSIKSVIVENNVDSAGKATDDHLEVTLASSGSQALTNVEVFYTYSDPTAKTSESYYLKLPASFSIPAGGTRTAHFDTTGKPDHFPVNKFSLYYTSTNALDVTVVVSADGAAPQTTTVRKDAGGAETAD